MDISVIIVNYKTAEYILPNIPLLLSESDSLEILIVDNSECAKEYSSLEKCCQKYDRVRLLKNRQNIGFGRACNLALAEARHPYILYLNPDTVVLPGELKILYRCILENGADAVGPRIYLDRHKQFKQPPFYNPEPFHLVAHSLLPKWYSRYWRKHSRWFWDLELPTPLPYLSGAVFLIARDVAKFDEEYFMYFEDAALFRSLRRHKVLFCPESEFIHFFDVAPSAQKGQHFLRSEEQFYRSHFPMFAKLFKKIKQMRRLYIHSERKLCEIEGLLTDGVRTDFALTPDFVPFVEGVVVEGDLPEFMQKFFSRLLVDVGKRSER